MDTQGKIIALLQGEMQDHTQVRSLLADIIDSSDNLGVFLRQIDIEKKLSRMRTALPPTPSSVQKDVQNRVAKHMASTALLAIPGQTDAAAKPVDRSPAIGGKKLAAGIVLGLLLLSAGYLLGQLVPMSGKNNVQIGHLRQELQETQDSLQQHPANRIPQPAINSPDTTTARRLSEPNTAEVHPGRGSGLIRSSAPFSLAMLTPSGTTSFAPGDIVPFTWSGSDGGTPLSLLLSSDGGITWETLAEDLTTNRYMWEVPKDAAISDHYVCQVTSAAANPDRTVSLIKELQADTNGVTLDISPDGRYVATAGRTEEVIIRDLHSGALKVRMYGHGAPIQSCRYNSAGTKIVTTALDGTAMIWDLETQELEHILDGGLGNLVWWATFSPDGRTVATAQEQGIVILWDANTGEELNRLKIHDEGVRYVDFSADGTRLLSTSSDRTGAVTDIRSGQVLHRFLHYASEDQVQRALVNTIALTEDESVAITGGYDGTLKFWDMESGEIIQQRIYSESAAIGMIRISPDGRYAVVVDNNGSAYIVDPYNGAEIATIGLDRQGSQMIHLAFTPDSKKIAISHTDGLVSVWSTDIRTVFSGKLWSITGTK